jgi:enoyl-CoA hydratase/carnithine racemase
MKNLAKLWLEMIERLEKKKQKLQAWYLTSAKSTFFAGADIDNLYKQTMHRKYLICAKA